MSKTFIILLLFIQANAYAVSVADYVRAAVNSPFSISEVRDELKELELALKRLNRHQIKSKADAYLVEQTLRKSKKYLPSTTYNELQSKLETYLVLITEPSFEHYAIEIGESAVSTINKINGVLKYVP